MGCAERDRDCRERRERLWFRDESAANGAGREVGVRCLWA